VSTPRGVDGSSRWANGAVEVAKADRLSRDVHFISGLMSHRVPFIVAAFDPLPRLTLSNANSLYDKMTKPKLDPPGQPPGTFPRLARSRPDARSQ
jgi:hypothetical protein